MSSELPTELWLQILTHLPRRTLSNVAGVSRLLHALAAPLRFAKFQYHPGIYTEDVGSGTRLKHEVARLAFWSSAHIAPLVRTCVVALYRGPIDPPSPLVAALFTTVSTFTNLRFMTFNCPAILLELPMLRVEALQHLHKLHLHGARLVRPAAALNFKPLKVAHFAYTDMHPLPSDLRSCLPMLDPSTLRTLELASDRVQSSAGPGPTDFLNDAQAMGACLSLHTLRLSLAHTDFTRLHAAVAPFPALRTLHIEIAGSCRADVLPPRTPMAPYLRTYRGPATLLPLVLPGAQPARLALTSGRAAEVRDALRGAGPECAAWLTSLEMSVVLHADVLDGRVLQELLALCPRLAYLALVVSSDEDHPLPETEALCARLADALRLPRALETVAFRWRLGGVSVPDRTELQQELQALLRTAVPGLKEVVFYARPRQLEVMGFDAADV
ncbi:hypothetical protein FB451DRAFT_1448799 [Mycena latifolia]|nr:hypothetical protein FB451DRAFT_1448799 [Mycena latifolia]